jgi:putative phosphonate catabolism associated alcohol dehydrogenase
MPEPHPDVAQVALLTQVGQPLEVHNVPVPSLRAGEMLVKIEACTLCRSDLHSIEGHRSSPMPLHAGHEMVGRIVAIASESSQQVGDRVTWGVAAFCGDCFYCRDGLTQKCSQLFKYGHESHDEHPLSGGLADYIVLRAGTPTVDVPEDLPWQTICPANCATATSAGAVRLAGQLQDRVVVICGAGMLGMTTAAMANYGNAAAVVVADIRSDRLQAARRFGATHVVDVTDGFAELVEVVDELSSGRGADVVIDMSGAVAAIEASIHWLRIGGRLVLVGSVFPSPAVAWDPERIVRNLITVTGLHNYNERDLKAAVDFLSVTRDQFPWGELVSKPYELRQINDAILAGTQGSSLRVAIKLNMT